MWLVQCAHERGYHDARVNFHFRWCRICYMHCLRFRWRPVLTSSRKVHSCMINELLSTTISSHFPWGWRWNVEAWAWAASAACTGMTRRPDSCLTFISEDAVSSSHANPIVVPNADQLEEFRVQEYYLYHRIQASKLILKVPSQGLM